MLDSLSEIEQATVDAARCGVWAGPNVALVGKDLSVTDDPGLRVRAVVIRELLMGRRGELDPHGVRIQGVQVVGLLDLDHVAAIAGLVLDECVLMDGLTCEHASIRELILTGCVAPALHATGLRTDGDLRLRGGIMRGAREDGVVRLVGAHVGGQLDLDRSVIINDSGSALERV
ncbi:hypothetical protein [Actinophytocola xanthii]|uniref:hypothetical protein n=1 Tax=Actinophytocola xanthii TaxID=1912961 RepID=UPI0011780A2B|nr:hypothetical protein [Actinophytocola xanthii]